jgi:hypothetical protein
MSKTRSVLALIGLPVVGIVLSVSAASAQFGQPKAELTPVIQRQAIQPGQTVTLELKVELPEANHVQSDEPRDPYLIPTRLTFTLPQGITVEAITYPESTDFLLVGQEEPLAVFEHEFTIEARLVLADDVSAGEMLVPGRFQYQACDDRLCFPPVNEAVEWRVQVEPTENH